MNGLRVKPRFRRYLAWALANEWLASKDLEKAVSNNQSLNLISAGKRSLCWSLVLLLFALVAPVLRAQHYSLNIVGYSTVTIAPNYNLLANPLKAGVTNGAN